MDIFLIILAGLLLIIGLLGCIMPILPGVPLCYVGILLLHFTSKIQFSTTFLVVWAVIVVAIQVLDYFIPIWGTAWFGGSRWGTLGSVVGIVVGMFFGVGGIVIGPFIGAVIGELLTGRAIMPALKAGFGSFVGFMAGSVSKLVVAGFLIFYYIRALIQMI